MFYGYSLETGKYFRQSDRWILNMEFYITELNLLKQDRLVLINK